MNNELRTLAILFGQISSTILIIVMIWVLGDMENGKKLISYLFFEPFTIKIVLSILIFIVSFISVYKNLKLLIKNDFKDNCDE
jgi:hypothetical protein